MSLLENSQTPLLFLYFNAVEKTRLDQFSLLSQAPKIVEVQILKILQGPWIHAQVACSHWHLCCLFGNFYLYKIKIHLGRAWLQVLQLYFQLWHRWFWLMGWSTHVCREMSSLVMDSQQQLQKNTLSSCCVLGLRIVFFFPICNGQFCSICLLFHPCLLF